MVFPEGTRSVTGELADFLPSLGYLALRAEVGILPAYIGGTFASMPKGAALPRSRASSSAAERCSGASRRGKRWRSLTH